MGRKKIKKNKKKIKVKSKKIDKKVLSTSKGTSLDEKIEIKKIKKQPTEKKIYGVNDFVVYPKHGVGKITAVEKAVIGDIDINFYKVLIERDKLTLTIPINQQSNLRPVCSSHQVNKCISILKSKPKVKRTMWSRRAQEYDQKINSGDIEQIAEVVRDLNRANNQIEQSYSERQLFELAYDRFLREVIAGLNIPEENAIKKVDKVLGRDKIKKAPLAI